MPQHAPRPHGTWTPLTRSAIPQVPATRDPVCRVATAAIIGALLVLSAGVAVAYPCECPQGAVAPREEVAPASGHPVVRELCETPTPAAREMCPQVAVAPRDLVTRPTAQSLLGDLSNTPNQVADVVSDAHDAADAARRTN